MFKKIAAIFKKELMLSVSLAAAIASLFITPPSKKLISDIDWKTLATLFMLLSVLEGFKKENIFRPLLQRAGKLSTIRGLTTFFVFSVFFSSMFVTNDVSLIIFVPLTIILFRAGNKEKYTVPVLVLENIAAVRGSLLTPFGSPQNLFLFSQSGVTAPNFMLRMLPLWICSGILLFLFILFMYRKDLKERIIIEETEFSEEWKPEQKKIRILYITLFIIIIATIVTRTSYWPIVTLVVFLSVLIFDRGILVRTDYVLLLTFLCFFIFSSSIASNPAISEFLKSNVVGNEYWWSILLSQVVSNVPASIILWPFTTNLTALLYGLDSAGLVSIIGSLASVINYRLYAREYPGRALYFMKWFEIISLAFFAIIVAPQFFLAQVR
jgi:Na+/H+ antiporter NhaD/arsenite permease-like protein